MEVCICSNSLHS